MLIETKPRATILDPREVMDHCLSDLTFQDWLAYHGLLSREEPPVFPKDPSLLDSNTPIGMFRLRLAQTPGYIVSYNELQRILGENPTDKFDFERFKKDPILPRSFEHIGWAYGVEDFLLRRGSIPSIHRLWLNLGGRVTDRELALATYGVSDEGLIDNVNHIMRTQIPLLEGSRVNIATFYHHNGRRDYMLRDFIPTVNDYYPNYFRKPFQDFLASEAVGIMSQNDYPPVQITDLFPKHSKVRQLVEVLEENRKYIVTYEYISERVYHEKVIDEKIRSLIKEARKRVTAPNNIYVLEGIGAGLGIDKVTLNKGELRVLYELWKKAGQPLSTIHLANHLFGAITERAQERVRERTDAIRIALSESQYQVINNPGKGYRLESRTTLT